MTTAAERYRWSSAPASLGLAADPIMTFHPAWLAMGPDPAQRAQRHREWLQQALADEDLQAIRAHLRQERALGDPRFQAMAEKTLNRPVAVRPRGRPRKEDAASPA